MPKRAFNRRDHGGRRQRPRRKACQRFDIATAYLGGGHASKPAHYSEMHVHNPCSPIHVVSELAARSAAEKGASLCTEFVCLPCSPVFCGYRVLVTLKPPLAKR